MESRYWSRVVKNELFFPLYKYRWGGGKFYMNVIHFNFNSTGRKFVCLKTDDDLHDNFGEDFKVGERYLEAKKDSDHMNEADPDKNYLLYSERGLTLYVEADGFELVENNNYLANLLKIWPN